MSLNYLLLVSQCTKYGICFTTFLCIWKSKTLGFFCYHGHLLSRTFSPFPSTFEIADVDCVLMINYNVCGIFKYKWRSFERLSVDTWSFLAHNILVSCNLSKNLAKILRRSRSTYVQNIFSYSFFTFEVVANHVADEGFLNMHLGIFMNITPWIWTL